MRNFLKWGAIVLGVLLVVGVVGALVWGAFAMRGGPVGYDGMRGGRMPFYGGFPAFGGGLRLIGMLILPLLAVGLLVWGILALARGGSRFQQPISPSPAGPAPLQAASPFPAPVKTCAHCSRPIDPTWVACPYCGEKVETPPVQ